MRKCGAIHGIISLYRSNGKVNTEIVPNASRKTLQDIIRRRVELETIFPLSNSFFP
ncbi:MAG: hypothetical protein O6940_07960 [Ignavibacteria bacterium]|nr:hypothetical protein [Ignavibacteria bacterium]